MSEEKLYAVKNDEGQYFDIDLPPWWDDKTGIASKRINLALGWAKKYGGHVVTLIEEPKKVVLTKEQAEIVEGARGFYLPASFISSKSDDEEDEELLMKAYVNGWTVEKQKRWNVKVPHAEKTLYRKHDSGALFASIYVGPQNHANDFLFTAAEIEHYGLQDCEKEDVTDDDD